MKITFKRFGIGDWTPDGRLDYSCHLQEEKTVESDHDSWLLEAELMEAQDLNEAADRVWSIAAEWDVFADWYGSYAVSGESKIILAEIGDWTVVRYNCYAGWPVIFRRKDVDYGNYLTLGNKSKAYALMDGSPIERQWYAPYD